MAVTESYTRDNQVSLILCILFLYLIYQCAFLPSVFLKNPVPSWPHILSRVDNREDEVLRHRPAA